MHKSNCRGAFLAARRSQHGRVLVEKGLSAPDSLVDLRTGPKHFHKDYTKRELWVEDEWVVFVLILAPLAVVAFGHAGSHAFSEPVMTLAGFPVISIALLVAPLVVALMVWMLFGGVLIPRKRAPALKQGGLFAPISREGALVLNNLLVTTACATVFIGTLYPLALEVLTGEKISVGAPFFNFTFAPLFVPLLVAVPFGPLLAWKRGDLLGAAGHQGCG